MPAQIDINVCIIHTTEQTTIFITLKYLYLRFNGKELEPAPLSRVMSCSGTLNKCSSGTAPPLSRDDNACSKPRRFTPPYIDDSIGRNWNEVLEYTMRILNIYTMRILNINTCSI